MVAFSELEFLKGVPILRYSQNFDQVASSVQIDWVRAEMTHRLRISTQSSAPPFTISRFANQLVANPSSRKSYIRPFGTSTNSPANIYRHHRPLRPQSKTVGMSQEEDQVSSNASMFNDSEADFALAGVTSQPQDQQSVVLRIQEELSMLLARLPETVKETASTTIATVKEKPNVIMMPALFLHAIHKTSSSGLGAGAVSFLDLGTGHILAARLSQQIRSLRMWVTTGSVAVGEETSGLDLSKTIDWLVSNPTYTLLAAMFAYQGVGGDFPAITASVCHAFGSDTVSTVKGLFPSADLNFWSSIAKRYERTKQYFADAEALNRKPNPPGTSKADIRRMLKKAETESGSGASPVADTETSPETASTSPQTQDAHTAQTSMNRPGKRRQQLTHRSSGH